MDYFGVELAVLKQGVLGSRTFNNSRLLGDFLRTVCKTEFPEFIQGSVLFLSSNYYKLEGIVLDLINNGVLRFEETGEGTIFDISILDNKLAARILERYASKTNSKKRESIMIVKDCLLGKSKEELINELNSNYRLSEFLNLERGSVMWYLDKFGIIRKVDSLSYELVESNNSSNFYLSVLEKVREQLFKSHYY